MADESEGGSRSATADDEYDLAAPRNVVALVAVGIAVLVISRTYGHRYLYVSIGAVALMKPLLSATVGIALCLVGALDIEPTLAVLGIAYVCRKTADRAGRRASLDGDITAEDLEAFTEALEYRAGRWYLQLARLDEATARRLVDAGLVYPAADGVTSPLTRRGARLARQRLFASDVPDVGGLWTLSGSSSAPVYLVLLVTLISGLLAWRPVPETLDLGRTAAALNQDLGAAVTAEEFTTASSAISRASDARALLQPLACRLFLATDDDLAMMVLQTLMLSSESLDGFSQRCPRVPEHVATIGARAEVVVTDGPAGESVLEKATPLLNDMAPLPRLVGALRIGACLNDARGDRLTAGHQLTVARAVAAQRRIAPSAELERICPTPTVGYTEIGTGTEIMIRPSDYQRRIADALR